MPSLELRVMGEVIYPQGPLTKWSTLICFPSIWKRRQNSRLLSSAPLLSFPLRPVTPCEQWKALNFLFLSGFFAWRLRLQTNQFSRVTELRSVKQISPFCFFSFALLSSARQFASCKITHSAGLLIGSREASSRFKWKCRVCPESEVMRSDELGPHGNAAHLMPL